MNTHHPPLPVHIENVDHPHPLLLVYDSDCKVYRHFPLSLQVRGFKRINPDATPIPLVHNHFHAQVIFEGAKEHMPPIQPEDLEHAIATLCADHAVVIAHGEGDLGKRIREALIYYTAQIQKPYDQQPGEHILHGISYVQLSRVQPSEHTP